MKWATDTTNVNRRERCLSANSVSPCYPGSQTRANGRQLTRVNKSGAPPRDSNTSSNIGNILQSCQRDFCKTDSFARGMNPEQRCIAEPAAANSSTRQTKKAKTVASQQQHGHFLLADSFPPETEQPWERYCRPQCTGEIGNQHDRGLWWSPENNNQEKP
jgi:hypothetical protein